MINIKLLVHVLIVCGERNILQSQNDADNQNSTET